ncbi:hypothetical protein [Xanthomonas sp. XNM01]|uniref:hypothetical protein n=1 Tax=Xanthomonas sp. XNM01 TaxID=2769289 RepID=UPI00177F353F|nr:hypothetical protein [Xanthomonas sp. XNM01]MBD9370125.1 hypothetical protein [Xanthomonas sp. XNM01]
MGRNIGSYTLRPGALQGDAHNYWYGTITVRGEGRAFVHTLDRAFFRTELAAHSHARLMIARVAGIERDRIAFTP